MLQNQLRSALRNLFRYKFYSFINLAGLTLGICCCLLIYIYVHDELSFDRFHAKADRTYRINQTAIWSESPYPFASTGPGVAFALEAELPEVEQVMRIHTPGTQWINIGSDAQNQRSFHEESALAADSNFFEVFDFTLTEGDVASALTEPYSVILSAASAQRFFGDQPALGQNLLIGRGNQQRTHKVTGILAPLPDQSHFHFELLFSMNSFPGVKRRSWSWIWTGFVTYVVLKPEADPALVAEKLKPIPRRHAAETLRRVMNLSFDEYIESGKKWELFMQPLTEIWLHSGRTSNRLGPTSDIRLVYIFTVTALLIFLLSCINFMNLATARASQRAKEVGIRKVLGSHRSSLIQQFLMESTLFSLLAMLLALGLVDLLLPLFNLLAGKILTVNALFNFPTLMLMLGIAFLIGILAGSYPAFYLTAFQPVAVLKGKLKAGMKSKSLRNGLVGFQFFISMALVIGTLLVQQQLQYTRNYELGFDKENVLILPHIERLNGNFDALKQELKSLPSVQHIGYSDCTPPNIWDQDYFKGLNSEGDEIPLNYLMVDAEYIPTLGLEFVAGTGFRENHKAHQKTVILNETAISDLGWGKLPIGEVIGQRLLYPGIGDTYEVIGVVKDFHFYSLRSEIQPLVFFYDGAPIYSNIHKYLSLRLSESVDAYPEVLQAVEQVWERYTTGIPFEYRFLDEDFDRLYRRETRMGQVLGTFTGIAIFIACLGLLGLTAFTAEQRNKEIGIRKVLGAELQHILALLGKEFSLLILAAFVFAAPLAYYLIQQWLQDFAYRMSIGPGVFVLAFVLTLVVAWLSVGFHVLKAARTNPTEVLRSE